MKTSDEIHQILEELHEVLQQVLDIKDSDILDVARSHSDDALQTTEPLLAWMKELFRDLKSCRLDGIPVNTAYMLRSQVREACDYLNRLISSPAADKANHLAEFQMKSHDWFINVVPVVAYASDIARRNDSLRDEAAAALAETKRVRDSAIDEFASQRNETGALLESMRTVVAETGVARHAQHFAVQAKESKRAAYWWLGGAGLVALVGVTVLLVARPYAPPANPSSKELVQFTISNLVLVSLFAFAVTFCARNHSACEHNRVVNLNRHNALRTFEAFLASTVDPATKNAVLLQVSQAIFAPLQTGYLKGEDDHSSSPSVLGIVKELTSSGGSK